MPKKVKRLFYLTLLIASFLIFIDLSGVSHKVLEKNYHTEFSYPLDVEPRKFLSLVSHIRYQVIYFVELL